MRASIVISNHDYERFVGTAIASALEQTWGDVEVIVVDDGSGDGSRDVIAGFGDAVIAVLKENGGQASAINAGVAASSGDVVLLLDADDWFLPHKVERVIGALRAAPGAGWCFHPLQYDGAPTPVQIASTEVVDVRADLRRGRRVTVPAPATSGLAFTRTLLDELLPINEELRVPLPSGARGTAADAYLKAAAIALASGVLLSEELAVQRVHDANAFTAGRNRGNPRRAALELEIAGELRERWPELRRYALRRGLGGLRRLHDLGADDVRVAAFLDGCTARERISVRVRRAMWRLRR